MCGKVPFLFKNLVDNLGQSSVASSEAGFAAAQFLDAAAGDPIIAVPFALVASYGVARTTAAACQVLLVASSKQGGDMRYINGCMGGCCGWV